MSAIKIGKETYGLIMVSSNVGHYFFDDQVPVIAKIKDACKSGNSRNDSTPKISFINSWSILGMHDIAILIKSETKLDNAIIEIGNILKKNNATIEVEKPDQILADPAIEKHYDRLNGLASDNRSKKYLNIYDFWCEPLIPVFINNKKLTAKNDCVILYLRLLPGVEHFNILENSLIAENIEDESILAIFNGFGIYDMIFFLDIKSFGDIQKKIDTIRKEFADSIIESCPMIAIHKAYDQLSLVGTADIKLPFSLIIKAKQSSHIADVWNSIDAISSELGVLKSAIVDMSDKNTSNKRITISNKQGFYDIQFIGYGDIKSMILFCKMLESLPFIEDYSSMINLETETLNMSRGI